MRETNMKKTCNICISQYARHAITGEVEIMQQYAHLQHANTHRAICKYTPCSFKIYTMQHTKDPRVVTALFHA